MRGIIFIDIDGTLLDSHYKTNSDDVGRYISRLQSKGIAFSLNSNRSLNDILPVAEEFNIDGPLVCENGIFYTTARNATPRPLLPDRTVEKIRETKIAFERKLKTMLDENFEDSYSWIEADTVDLLSQDTLPEISLTGSLVFINNQFRKYTTSVHVFRQFENKLTQAPSDVVDKICKLMTDWAEINDFTVAHGHEFANILAYTNRASKKTAVQELKAQHPNASFMAIGNESSDAKMIDDTGVFYAVGNAADEAKRAAEYVATASTAQGVVEILRFIEEAMEKES